MYSNNQREELPPTPSALINHYFSEEMVDNIVNSSNAYAFERKWREPNLKSWKNKTVTKTITPSYIYHFLPLYIILVLSNYHRSGVTGPKDITGCHLIQFALPTI